MVAPRYMPLIGYAEGWSAPTAGAIEATPLFIGDQTADQVEADKGSLKGAIVLTQPLQTGFVRADRAQPATSDAPVRIGAPPMPPSGRSQADQRRIARDRSASAGAGVLIRANAGEHGTMFVLGRDAGRGGAAVDRPGGGALQHDRAHARGGPAGQAARRRSARAISTPTATATTSSPRFPAPIRRSRTRSCSSAAISTRGTARPARPTTPTAPPRCSKRCGSCRRSAPGRAARSGSRSGAARSRDCSDRRPTRRAISRARRTPPRARSSTSTSTSIPAPVPSTAGICRGSRNVAPLFDAWLAPFKDIGARRNVTERIGNTDHLSFTALGLPGFNPIQDYVELRRPHASHQHGYLRARQREGHGAVGVVFASFAWHAAMRDEKIPRPPPRRRAEATWRVYARAFPYNASKRLHAFSACGSL